MVTSPRPSGSMMTPSTSSYELDLFGHVRRSHPGGPGGRPAADRRAGQRPGSPWSPPKPPAPTPRSATSGEEIAVARRSVEVVSREADILARRLQAGGGSGIRRGPGRGPRRPDPLGHPAARRPEARGPVPAHRSSGPSRPSQAPLEVETVRHTPRLSALIPVGDGASLLKRRPGRAPCRPPSRGGHSAYRRGDRRHSIPTRPASRPPSTAARRLDLSDLVNSEILASTWGVGPKDQLDLPQSGGCPRPLSISPRLKPTPPWPKSVDSAGAAGPEGNRTVAGDLRLLS